jgi:hypothetical protein
MAERLAELPAASLAGLVGCSSAGGKIYKVPLGLDRYY